MAWKPFKLRDSEVWARVDEAGQLIPDSDGRVDVIYKAQHGAKLYRASAKNLAERPGPVVEVTAGEAALAPSSSAASTSPSRAAVGRKGVASHDAAMARVPDGAVMVWTDGGCAPNPGPGAIGVVIVWPDSSRRIELGDYLGASTNNICELTAIQRGLELVLEHHGNELPVVVFADSAYAIGLLSQGWKAKANQELVASLRTLCKRIPRLSFVKVAAHVGVTENERVDGLVNEARRKRGRVFASA